MEACSPVDGIDTVMNDNFSGSETGVQALLDNQAIRECLYRYVRGMDRQDFEMTLSVWNPGGEATYEDAVYEGSESGNPEAFMRFAAKAHQDFECFTHQLTNILIRVDGNTADSMPVEHTRWVRERVGPDKAVIPCVRIHLDPNGERGRKLARRHLELQGFLRAYQSAWKRLGMIETVEESAEGIDDELLEAVNVFGDVALILKRIEAHLDAGASRVILVAVADAIEGHEVGLAGFRELAEAVWG